MSAERNLDWQGCFNVRDLGGLPTADGRRTLRGAIVRADSLQRLTAEGWAALLEHGVRTVIDLRNDSEIGADHAPRPDVLNTIHIPLDPAKDREFATTWEGGPQFGTPLYYRAHLQRHAALSVAVLAAIADAAPGGVVFHCVGGRDRSGQIAMLVLALAGVAPQDIAADYSLSAERLRGLFAAVGQDDQAPELEAFLAARGTTAAEVVITTLASLDVEHQLRGGGLTDRDLTRLRERVLEPAWTAPARGS
jgi:protein-tyrosine phosphatase